MLTKIKRVINTFFLNAFLWTDDYKSLGLDNLDSIILQTKEARENFDNISEQLRQIEGVVSEDNLLKIGDNLADLQTRFQRIRGYAYSQK